MQTSLIAIMTVFFSLVAANERPTYELVTNAAHYLSGSGNGESFQGVASDDGTFIAFQSAASNLVPGDQNGVHDIFVADRNTGSMDLVSSNSHDEPLATQSSHPDISDDGRFVVFANNGSIWIKDRVSRELTIASRSPTGQPVYGRQGKISGNGVFVVFTTLNAQILGTATSVQVVVYDRLSGSITVLSTTPNGELGNGNSKYPSISDDGLRIVFQSSADNLAADFNDRDDIFLVDRVSETISVVSEHADIAGNEDSVHGVISGDGSAVAFISRSSDWFPNVSTKQVYRRILASSLLDLVSTSPDGGLAGFLDDSISISDDGEKVSLSAKLLSGVEKSCNIKNLANGMVQSLQYKETLRHESCSVVGDGDGAILTSALSLVNRDNNQEPDVYFTALASPEPILISIGTDGAALPAGVAGAIGNYEISGDGTTVAFNYRGSDLADQVDLVDSYVYLFEGGAEGAELLTGNGAQVPSESVFVNGLTEDSRRTLISTSAQNLGALCSYPCDQLFLFDPSTAQLDALPEAEFAEFSRSKREASMSANGRLIVFASSADTLVSVDVNNSTDIFVLDRQSGMIELVSQSTNGIQSDTDSSEPFISGNGRFVVFSSQASTLTEGLSGNVENIFIHDRQSGATKLASSAIGSLEPNCSSRSGRVANDGRVVFLSCATDLTVEATTSWQAYLFQASDLPVTLLSQNDTVIASYCNSVDISANGAWAALACGGETLDRERDRVEPNFSGNYAYRRSLISNRIELIAVNQEGKGVESGAPRLSATGTHALFSTTTPGVVAGSNGRSQLILAEFAESPLFTDGFEER